MTVSGPKFGAARRGRMLTMAIAALCGGAISLASLGTAHAATKSGEAIVFAEGTSSTIFGTTTLLDAINTVGPIDVGPVPQAQATTPPGTTTYDTKAVENCNVVTAPPCVDPAASVVQGGFNTAKASLVPVTNLPTGTGATGCNPGNLPPGFTGSKGPFPGDGATGTNVIPEFQGGNACSVTASAGAINNGAPVAPKPLVLATGVAAQSLTLDCHPKTQSKERKAAYPGEPVGLDPIGNVNIATLTVGGADVLLGNNNPKPNTQLNPLPAPLDALQIVLNEQVLDNVNPGQGLTVNAIHIFTTTTTGPLAGINLVIGHTHSSAVCASQTTLPAPNPTGGPGITKGGPTTAKAGDTIQYPINIKANKDSKGTVCKVNRVEDTLPAGFSFVSATGNLGTATVSGQRLLWSNVNGFPDPINETLTVKVDPAAREGQFFQNLVSVFSDCGSSSGSSPPLKIIADAPPAPPTAAPTTPPTLINTSTASSKADLVAPVAGGVAILLLLGVVPAVRRIRNR